MRVDELIAKMRPRLRDEDAQWWSNDELHDNINIALAAIAHKLMPWKGRWNFITSSGVDTYSIPEDFMSPISLIVDGAMIPIKGAEYALSTSSEEACGFIDNDALILYPAPSGAMEVALNYHGINQTVTIADEIKLAPELIDTVMVYALSLSLQKQATEESLEQSKYYLNLYTSRCGDVVKVAHARRNSPRARSTYQRI